MCCAVFAVYDSGTVFHPSILDMSDDDLRARFMQGVTNVACISLTIGYPTLASVPHSIINGFKNLLAIAAATDIDFKEAETVSCRVVLKVFSCLCGKSRKMVMKEIYGVRSETTAKVH